MIAHETSHQSKAINPEGGNRDSLVNRQAVKELSNGESVKAADKISTSSEDKGVDNATNAKPKDREMLVSEGVEVEEEEAGWLSKVNSAISKGAKVEEKEGWLSKVNPGVRLRLKEQLIVVL